MNKAQEETLAQLNDSWGVAKWIEKDEQVHLELDDGEKIILDENGEVVRDRH